MTKKILIIDDHRLFADGLCLVLSQSSEYQISTYYNARSVLENSTLLNQHDLVLIDLDMPGLDGFGFLNGIKERNLKIKVIVVSGTEKRSDINRILQMGAKGFLPKTSPSEIMLEGVRKVLIGERYVPHNLSNEIDWLAVNSDESESINKNSSIFTDRQIQILKLLSDGYSNKDIAQVLDVTESTVKSHISLLFKSLGVKNRTACVQKGIEQSLISGFKVE